MRILYTNPSYPEFRTIINKCRGVEYVRSRPVGSMLEKIAGNCFLPRSAKDFLCSASHYYCGGVHWPIYADGAHFFNIVGICGGGGYISTFESTLPYVRTCSGWWWEKGVESLLSNKCKRLLALCECTRTIQSRFSLKHGFNEVMKKVEVLHPPQALLTTESEIGERDYTKGPLKFVFVGAALIHKGGGEVLRVLDRLHHDFPIDLTIVGRFDELDGGDAATRRPGYMYNPRLDDLDELKRIIHNGSDWIHYYDRVENSLLLQMFKSCHVGLLPTRSDTYGYSVLEMQAAGVPLITSNVRALPEINPDACGWMFEVEKNENGNFPDISQNGIERLSSQIERGLEKSVLQCIQNRDLIRNKAIAAFRRVRDHHNPEEYGRKLFSLYEECFG